MVALIKPDNQIVDTIIQGDALEVLRTLDACSVDACVVDPPYGLGEVKDIAGLLQAWIHDEDDSRYLGKSGFMGKEWDAGVPGTRYWREVLRVMKPGAHILCFASTRTVDLMMIALRLAGFQCRDTLMWVYGQGFPKNTDISKKIDKMRGAERKVIGRSHRHAGGTNNKYAQDEWTRNNAATMGMYVTAPATPEARQHAGTGTALKPAHEPIILARKPLSEKSIAENCLKWGTGGLAIDQCRVGTSDTLNIGTGYMGYHGADGSNPGQQHPQGRFPSNLLLSHSLFCVPLGTRKVRSQSGGPLKTHEMSRGLYELGMKTNTATQQYHDSDGMEEVEAWECAEDCPIRLLDEQSGIRKSGLKTQEHADHRNGMFSLPSGNACYSEQVGGASRYFTQFCYTAKASRAERNRGCEGLPEKEAGVMDKRPSGDFHTRLGDGTTKPAQNNHPTVKPLQLMSWLCRLITPPGGTVLDCFAGSGSTCVAAIHERLHFIAIEQDASYCEIARARVAQAFGEVAP